MKPNCDYCSEIYKDGDEIVEKVEVWKTLVTPGVRAMEMEIASGDWMHRACAILKKQDADQKPGQTSLI